MCYRASMMFDIKFLEGRYRAKLNPKIGKETASFKSYNFNGFAHPRMLIVPQQRPEVITGAFWGLMPRDRSIQDRNAYYKEAARYGAGLNARSEKVFDHFIYKHSIFEQRCIVPLSGFYEPHKGPKGSYPFYFRDKDQDALSVAGLYSITKDGGVTYALLTKVATPLFENVHNTKKRQIVLLNSEMEKEWMNPDLGEDHIKKVLRYRYDENQLITYPVSKEVNSTKIHLDNQEMILPHNYPELEPFMSSLKDYNTTLN